MSIHRILLAGAFALSIGAAHAGALQPIQGQSIHLGDVSGVAYYTVEPAGFRLVATLAPGEGGTPVRIEAILAPGQSVVLSSPREAGAGLNAVEISRRGDLVVVNKAAVTH